MDTSVELAGMRLRNPTMLASGILGISYEVLKRVYEAGAGAVVSKSISIDAREGYRGPIIVKVDGGYVNAVGLSNPGIDAFVHELKGSVIDIPLIVNLVGSTVDEFVSMVKMLDSIDILAYELNLSCPHVEKVGLEVGDDIELVSRIIKGIKNVTSKPVIAKLGLGKTDMINVAKAAADSGCDAVTAINTVRAMVIDVERCMPVLSNRVGGLSGRSIKPIAVRCVYELYREGIPVIGCGGVYDWSDAIEFILAGASAVQIGSAIGDRWLHVFNDINLGISSYLRRKGFKSIKELIGLANKE